MLAFQLTPPQFSHGFGITSHIPEEMVVKTNNKDPSIESKKAFISKSRSENSRASLLLEGIQPPSSSRYENESKATVIARYRIPEHSR